MISHFSCVCLFTIIIVLRNELLLALFLLCVPHYTMWTPYITFASYITSGPRASIKSAKDNHQLSVFEMPTRVIRGISRRMRTKELELCSPERPESLTKWRRPMVTDETKGIGKRDSVLSKNIKSLWKILFLSHLCPNVVSVQII